MSPNASEFGQHDEAVAEWVSDQGWEVSIVAQSDDGTWRKWECSIPGVPGIRRIFVHEETLSDLESSDLVQELRVQNAAPRLKAAPSGIAVWLDQFQGRTRLREQSERPND